MNDKIKAIEAKIFLTEERIAEILRDEAIAAQQCAAVSEAIVSGDDSPRDWAASVAEAESVCTTLRRAELTAVDNLGILQAQLAAEIAAAAASERAARLDELAREMDALRVKDAQLWENARAALVENVNAILDLRDEAAAVLSQQHQLTGKSGPRIGELFGVPLLAAAPGGFGVLQEVTAESAIRDRAATGTRRAEFRDRQASAPTFNGGDVVGVAEPNDDEERDPGAFDHYDERHYQKVKEAKR